MNTARIIVLVFALGPCGIAAYPAISYRDEPAPPAQATEQLATVESLVAKLEINFSRTLKPEDLQRQTRPASAESAGFIRRPGWRKAVSHIGTAKLARSVDANASDGSNEASGDRTSGGISGSATAWQLTPEKSWG